MCSNAQVRTDRLGEAVWREVERLLHDPARIAAEYERRLDDARRRGTDGPDLAAAEVQLAKLRRGMGRLIDSYAEGLIERSEFEPRIVGFRQRIQGWEAQLKAMRDEAALQSTLSLVIGRLEDFAKRVHDRTCEVDWLMQRELIRTLVKRVEVNQDDINVVFRVDGTLPTPDPTSPGQNNFLQDCGRGNVSTCTKHALAEISKQVGTSAHALLVCDGTGWHQPGVRLTVPENITLLRLPPHAPELNPMENV